MTSVRRCLLLPPALCWMRVPANDVTPTSAARSADRRRLNPRTIPNLNHSSARGLQFPNSVLQLLHAQEQLRNRLCVANQADRWFGAGIRRDSHLRVNVS